MRERTRQLRGQRGVEVHILGEDRTGEVIEMVSLGDGARNVLVVGAPHPNEPIGCIGIEWLIEQFRADPALLRQTGCRWHFVKAIEPYALKQNEGWFQRPDLASYLHHFYRPALQEQAEYAFPPSSGPWQPVPENAAYQRALQLSRPDLLASLHNAEGGGAFYFLTRDDAPLAERLSAQALAQGLPLNLLGEDAPDVRAAPLAPGVFLLQDEGLASQDESAGASVTQYLARQPGPSPLVIVPEVPLFLHRNASTLAHSAEACLESVARGGWVARLDALSTDGLALMDVAATPLEEFYLEAIRESITFARQALDTLQEAKDKVDPDGFEAHVRASLVFALRPLAMTRRLAAMRAKRAELLDVATFARGTEQACARDLATSLTSPLLRDAFQPVPLHAAVATQLEAVLSAAQTVVQG